MLKDILPVPTFKREALRFWWLFLLSNLKSGKLGTWNTCFTYFEHCLILILKTV